MVLTIFFFFFFFVLLPLMQEECISHTEEAILLCRNVERCFDLVVTTAASFWEELRSCPDLPSAKL